MQVIMALSRIMFLLIFTLCVYLVNVHAADKRKDALEIPPNTLSEVHRKLIRIERLLTDIENVRREEKELNKKTDDDTVEKSNLEAPSEIVNDQTVEVKEPMTVDDIRHSSVEDTASKKEDADTAPKKEDADTASKKEDTGIAPKKEEADTAPKKEEADTASKKEDGNTTPKKEEADAQATDATKGTGPKKAEESPKEKTDDKTTDIVSKEATAKKVVDKDSNAKKNDVATKTNDADNVATTNSQDKEVSSKKMDKNEEASNPKEPNLKDKDVPTPVENSHENKNEKATDESKEAKDIDEASKDEISLIKLLEDEMKQRLNSKHKKHPIPAKIHPVDAVTDSESSKVDKDSDPVGDYLGDKSKENEEREKEVKQTELEQDSELKEFARFRQEVLRKIEKMLVGDVSLALRNGFTVQDIIKDIEKMKHKKEKVDLDQMEEDLAGLGTILAHEK